MNVSKSKILVYLIVFGCMLAIAVFVYTNRTAPKYSANHTVRTALKQENNDFNLADSERNKGNYQNALQYYVKALPQATDLSQEAQIKYDIAFMTELSGKHVESIALYKEIAANENYYSLIRAYAAQEIGMEYHLYHGESAIVSETFKDEPYESFKEGVTNAVAYKKLFEYAASIYPLSVSESFVAFGYAQDLVASKAATTSPQGKLLLAKITQALAKANEDMPRMSKVAYEASSLPNVYTRQAIVIAYLARIRVPGYSATDAENLYNLAFRYAAIQGTKKGNFLTYHYAVFLSQHYPKTRLVDIKKALSVFSTNSVSDIDPNLPPFFKSIRTSPDQAINKRDTKLLAQLDPEFKKYLITLGWNATDF